jgi:hypothetical protein
MGANIMAGRIGAVAAWLGLFTLLAMGTAQGLSGSDTVLSDDIVDGQVTTPDLQSGAVTSGKVRDGSLKGRDLALGSVGFAQLGAQWTAVARETLYGNVSGYAFAPCPSGWTAISGSASSPSAASAMMSSVPLNDGWFASFRNWYAANTYIDVQALCIPK